MIETGVTDFYENGIRKQAFSLKKCVDVDHFD